jgi:hypothetical protein
MITFKKLGKYGWLGNQMFQFAFLYHIGKKKNIQIGFDFKYNSLLSKMFKLPAENSDDIKQNTLFLQTDNSETIDASLINDGTDILGYFQNADYIKENEYDLRNIFTFDKEKHNTCINFIKKLKEEKNKELVAIHVRRGDYLHPIAKHIHYVCDENYFQRAVNFFGPNYFYIIFTDDKLWCSHVFKQIPNIIMNNDPEIDFILMSLCDHNIISNSSYSWWASWINENLDKKIVAPNKWYNIPPFKNWEKIYRNDMLLI